jgi:hypothetical protein
MAQIGLESHMRAAAGWPSASARQSGKGMAEMIHALQKITPEQELEARTRRAILARYVGQQVPVKYLRNLHLVRRARQRSKVGALAGRPQGLAGLPPRHWIC